MTDRRPSLIMPPSTGITRRGFVRGGLGLTAASLFAGSAGTLLAGCGSSSAGGSAKELTFWNFNGPAPDKNPQSQWFVDLAEEWNRNNEVKIRLHYMPVSEYLAGTALQTAFQSGEGPDIFLISPGDFLRYYNGGVLQDLTPYIPQNVRDDFQPGVLDTRMVDDKIYGLPMEVEPLSMFYDLKAWETAGLSEGDIPKTWDQLLDTADKLTTDKRFGIIFETIPGYYQNFTWYPFMWQTGADAVKDGKSVFDSPGTVKALQLWQDTIKNGWAPRKPQGDGGGNAPANLASGYVAMEQTGIWGVSDLKHSNPDYKYGVFKLPLPDGGTYTTDLGGWAFVANAKGKNPEAAAKFVAWALGSDDAESIDRCRKWNTVAKTNLPPRKSVRRAADAHGAYDTPVLRTFVEDIAPGGRPEPRFPPEVYKAISDALQSCQLGGADPAGAAADASSKIDSYLQTYQGAPIL
ncbi:sugar ABC transporter substrate-binding protein [Nocardioides sp. KR10-350]|uniref:ABC transporter substrate-binding protein n=1 Tax=Nocardioides cheoyonin TaxID=3156615 RepID=UPI0032B54D21